MITQSCFRRFLLTLLIAIGARARAQTNDPPVGVAVKIWAQGGASDDGASLTIWGNFLESSPGANNGGATATANGNNGDTLTAVLGTPGYVRVEAAKVYQI